MKNRSVPALLLAAALCLGALAGCAGPAANGSQVAIGGSGKRLGGNQLIGISLPDEQDGRWVRDAETIQAGLEKKGYLVEVAYAQGNSKTQQEQVKALLDDDCNVIIVAALEPEKLAAAMGSMDTSGATLISYHGVMEDCPAVAYSVAQDSYAAGIGQGEYLIKKLKLNKRTKKNPACLEIFHLAGSASGAYALQGAMKALKPYLDRKTLVIPSGQRKAEDCGVTDAAAAEERVAKLMKDYDAEGRNLDAVLCTDDGVSGWLAKGLDQSFTGSVYPLVAGCNGTCESLALTLNGRQIMTTVERRDGMAAQAAKMADQVLTGKTVSVTEQAEDNPCDQPAFLFAPMGVTGSNAEERIFKSKRYVLQKDGTVTVPGREKKTDGEKANKKKANKKKANKKKASKKKAAENSQKKTAKTESADRKS